jgi:hypothetical protein
MRFIGRLSGLGDVSEVLEAVFILFGYPDAGLQAVSRAILYEKLAVLSEQIILRNRREQECVRVSR